MRKTKLVLLTVLLLLVLYCGAVVFVTKPDSFAYEAIFGGIESIVSVPTSEQKLAEEQARRAAISAEIESVATQKASAAVNEAVMKAGIQTDDAVQQALDGFDEAIGTMVSKAVSEAFEGYENADLKVVADQVTANIEAGIDYYIPQIVNATIPVLLQYEDEFAQMLYDKYGEVLVQMVMAQVQSAVETVEEVAVEVAPSVEAEVVAEEIVAEETVVEEAVAEELSVEEPVQVEAPAVVDLTKEEYDAIREEVRESEINAVLDKLTD